LWRALTLVAALFSQLDAGYAQQAAPELPTEPILRIEAGQHGANIWRVDTDTANKFAVTASDDKTVRVWSLPDGKLQRVLRLPIDYGDIGKAYAVAISPDGSTVAVGGLTGSFGHNNIFLFDRASGALKQRLSAVVEGLRGAAARPQNPVIMISDLNGYISQRVRELTGGNQKPMMAMPKTIEDYPISRRLQ
jgi:WD40 repeat protein